MYAPTDILIRKTADGETIWLSQRLVVECCGVSNKMLKDVGRVRYKHSLPASWARLAEQAEFFLGDSGKSWRWGLKGGQYYYDYDRIPDRAPRNYRSMLPPKEDLIEAVEQKNSRNARERDAQVRCGLIQAVEAIEQNNDVLWIQNQSGYQIDIATARDYAHALAWCRMIRRTSVDRTFAAFGAPSSAAFFALCAKALAVERIKNLRIATPQSLRNKIAAMPGDPDEQLRWIVSGKYGNNNRQIVGKLQLVDPDTGVLYPFDLHKAVMYAAYMNFDGPQKEKLNALYDDVYRPTIVDFGLTPVKLRTFCHHLSRFSTRLLNDRQRHGEEYYNKHLRTYIPSERLSYAHSLFCGDGSGLLAYHYRNVKGELTVMNLYTMLISDVATGAIVGWSVAPEGSHKETPEMVRDAVRKAVRQGDNHTMFEFVSDNHGAFTKNESKEWLANVFQRVRTIAPSNSQANPAEIQFKLFKATLRKCKNFVRTSHNVGVNGRANLDKVNKIEYPTYSEVIPQMAQLIADWNNSRPNGCELTRLEAFNNHKNPECMPIDPIQKRLIFGITTKKEVTESRGVIIIGPKGNQLQYTIPDYATTGAEQIARATGYGYYATVKVIYDEAGADLYSADDKFIMTCPPAVKASQSYVEKTEAHRQAERALKRRQEEQLEAVERHEQEVLDATELMSRWSYGEEMQFGGDKESLNRQYEHAISTEVAVAMKKTAEKTRHALGRKEARAAEKAYVVEMSSYTEKHKTLRNKRLADMYK